MKAATTHGRRRRSGGYDDDNDEDEDNPDASAPLKSLDSECTSAALAAGPLPAPSVGMGADDVPAPMVALPLCAADCAADAGGLAVAGVSGSYGCAWSAAALSACCPASAPVLLGGAAGPGAA